MGEHVFGKSKLSPQCARMATAFSGGLGDTREELCGALSGGVMVISGLLGRESLRSSDKPAIELAARYRERFLATFGYTQCKQLREHVVYASEGLGSCGALVERAALVLLEVLDE